MEFQFDVARLLKEPVTVWDRNSVLQASKENSTRVKDVLDKMGAASAKAQGLKVPVTSYAVLLQSPDQRVYVFTEGREVVGIIKIGRKKLFIRSELDVQKEISPVCVLDFYVHESRQRTGRGKMLFEAMMERENIQPWKLGYDRPSVKFVNFLRKHYGLIDFTPQANNFVVFKRYFEDLRSASRNEQPNASVSMRPLTAANKRRNSFDERVHGRPDPIPQPVSYYTPQKPQSRPDTVTPLSLNQLPKNGPNPFSLKANPPQQKPQPQLQPQQSSHQYSSRSANLSNRQDSRGQLTNDYQDQDRDYNDREDYNNYDDRADRDYNDKYDDREADYDREPNYNDNERVSEDYNQRPMDDSIAPEDYANDSVRRHDTRNHVAYSSPSAPRNPTFATTSSSYGNHAPVKSASPTPYRPASINSSSGTSKNNLSNLYSSPSSSSFNASANLNGNGIFGLTGNTNVEPVRGRSPARQRSESPYAETANLSPAPSRQRSNSLDRTHVPPKGLGTLGNFSQSFAHPMKFEKDVAEPPHRGSPYKDSSVFPPRRETTAAPRSPAYRLGPSSRLNSREMDSLETSMRNALSTIDNNEKRVDFINDGGYRAISPEPRTNSRTDIYQSPQSRSIFSSVQTTGSPVARSVSPARFNREETERLDANFSKSDYHKRFHNENPNLMSSPPQAVRVHPNSMSRQSPFPR